MHTTVQAQWEFRLRELHANEGKFFWLSQLVWDIFQEVNLHKEWTIPTFTRREVSSLLALPTVLNSNCVGGEEGEENDSQKYLHELEETVLEISENFHILKPNIDLTQQVDGILLDEMEEQGEEQEPAEEAEKEEVGGEETRRREEKEEL